MSGIRCGKCKSYHPSVADVRNCYQQGKLFETPTPEPRKVAVPRPRDPRVPVTTPGVFRRATDQEVFVVKPNRNNPNRLYACKLVVIKSQRATIVGTRESIEFEYDKGAIFTLDESMRMDSEEAEKLTILYGKCICCGRKLKLAKSVEQGMGDWCRRKYFPSTTKVTVAS